jgi:hypothetical protein
MEQGDTESLPPRPMDVMQAELESMRAQVAALDEALQTAGSKGDAVSGRLEHAQESVGQLESALEQALDRLGVASAAIADTSESLRAAIADTASAAEGARRIVEQAGVGGAVDASAGRLLVWQQAPAWVLGLGVLALAFYLVYARIGATGPWVAVAVGLVMSVALTLRPRLWPTGGSAPPT